MLGTIGLLPGDGVGPEVMAEGVKVLTAIADRFGGQVDTFEILIGGASIDRHGVALRKQDIERCRAVDGLLLGAVGGPKWEVPGSRLRPEHGLLQLRKSLGLFANVRPVAVQPALEDASPLRPDVVRGVDLVVVRELTGGVYFGRPSRQWRERRGRAAIDTLIYREHEIERVARLAFQMARSRRRHVASVDKANVIETSRLWRAVVSEVALDFPDVALEHILVDAMAMHLIRRPSAFDVVVTENMFGDILTDEASVLAGSIGLLPSASLGADRGREDGRRFGLYEPIHGSAPDIAGAGVANPAGMILSVAMLCRTSFNHDDAAVAIELAVADTIADGIVTKDVAGRQPAASTATFGDEVVRRISG